MPLGEITFYVGHTPELIEISSNSKVTLYKGEPTRLVPLKNFITVDLDSLTPEQLRKKEFTILGLVPDGKGGKIWREYDIGFRCELTDEQYKKVQEVVHKKFPPKLGEVCFQATDIEYLKGIVPQRGIVLNQGSKANFVTIDLDALTPEELRQKQLKITGIVSNPLGKFGAVMEKEYTVWFSTRLTGEQYSKVQALVDKHFPSTTDTSSASKPAKAEQKSN